MGGGFQAEGGGVHPGKPIIWPTGKSSSTPVSSSPQSQTTGSARNVPAQTAPTAPTAPTTPTTPAAPATPVATPAPAPSISRALTVEDVRSHLLNVQIEPNDFNTNLAALMLRNGVELSRANFVKLMSMMQGSDKSQSMQEASVLLLMKGIDSPPAAKVLGQYFAENPGLASQMVAMQESMGNLSSALGMGKGLLDANFISQLGAVLAQFDETFKNLSEKSQGKNNVNREMMLNDARALKALLSGVKQKAAGAGGEQAKVLAKAIGEAQGRLDGLTQNMLAQALLSQSGRSEVNYLYHQIPNAMTNPPKDLEIVIKRDGEGQGSVVDPRNTQVVLSLELGNLGKLVVSMYVKDNKVYIVFVFEQKESGEKGRAAIAKEFGEFQQKLADKNYLITGYQVKVDPAMCHIKPYLIPMIASLESVLKKIDIEA
jgi:hypothetical protein